MKWRFQDDEEITIDREAALKNDLAKLNAGASKLAPELQKMVPTLRSVCERWWRDRDSMTELEQRLYKSWRGGARAIDDDLLPVVKKASAPPKVKTGENKIPGGASSGSKGRGVGYVAITVNGNRATVAEIPVAAGGMSPVQRAAKIAKRIQTAAQRNPLWWMQVNVGRKNGDAVVTAPTAPDGYVITADPDYARVTQTAPDELARRIAIKIRTAYDRPASRRDFTPEQQAAEDHAKAVDLRQRGDELYNSGSLAAAVKAYSEAVALDKNYLVAHERLVALLAESGQKDRARAAARTALALPGLDEAQRAYFTKMNK
jgi:tetratricopeptide (TPR) repeat protein